MSKMYLSGKRQNLLNQFLRISRTLEEKFDNGCQQLQLYLSALILNTIKILELRLIDRCKL